jgi:hypothetical protein
MSRVDSVQIAVKKAGERVRGSSVFPLRFFPLSPYLLGAVLTSFRELPMAVSAEVATLFLDELARRNIPVKHGEEGGYEIEIDGTKATIQLENLSRDFARDRDANRIKNFVDTITASIKIPDWEAARPRIRWSLEPTDMPLDDAIHDKVSDQVALVLVHVSADETQVMWLTDAMTLKWGQTKESLFAAAVENMQRLLAEASVEVTPVDEHKLGILKTKYTAFKAALVFCPGLKALAEPFVGWPLFVVMPCRDFVYLIPENARDILGGVGQVVVQEFNDSAYPLSTEVFELTDSGLRAFAEFQKKPREEPEELEEPEVDADGMKTIHYRGGTVVFRIPAYWEEEYAEEGGGTFYDEDVDSGTFRLNTLLLKSQEPVTTHSAKKLADNRAVKESGKVTELANGNWMVETTHHATEDGTQLTILYWVIMNPVPPDHIRVAMFSYTARTEQIEERDEDVLGELELLNREVRAATFATVVGE